MVLQPTDKRSPAGNQPSRKRTGTYQCAVSEPLFNFTTEALPQVRVITRYQGLNVYDRDYNELIDRMNKYRKRMIVVGQMNLIYLFEKRYTKLLYKHFAWLTEHIGNRTVPAFP